MKNNLYLIVGTDENLISFHLEEILKKKTYEEDNKINYDMNIFTLKDIIDEASMMSLFGENKIIIGSNFNMSHIDTCDYEYLEKYLHNQKESTTIILITDKLNSKHKLFTTVFTVIDLAKTDNEKDIFNYVKSTIKESNYLITDNDIDYLITRTGSDINNIKNELDKLLTYKIDTKKIDKSDIDLLIPDNIDNVIYEFTNAIYDNNYELITTMYQKFMRDNVSIDYLLVSINNSFRQSLIIKNLYNKGKSNKEIAAAIGKKEFFVKKSLERLYQYTEADLADFINKLAKIDYDYKSGKSKIDMLELLLYNKDIKI